MIGKVPGLRRFERYTAGGGDLCPAGASPDYILRYLLEPSPLLMERKRMNLKARVDQTGNVTRVELVKKGG